MANKGSKTPKSRLIDVGLPARRDGGRVGEINLWGIGGAAHMAVNIGGNEQFVALVPGQVRHRWNSGHTKLTRVLRDYRIPNDDPRVPAALRGATVLVRHSTNDDDRKRKLNRSEALRLIAHGHEDWEVLTQRSRAESLNQWIKDRWPDKCGPAVGRDAQRRRLIFAAIGRNFVAAVRYRARTGVDVLEPPPLAAVAA